jgi:hypothetical protein
MGGVSDFHRIENVADKAGVFHKAYNFLGACQKFRAQYTKGCLLTRFER